MIQVKVLNAPDCNNCDSKHGSAFSVLYNDELTILSSNKSCHTYKDGEIIFSEDKYPSGIYCVHKGKIKISRSGQEGREHIVRFATTGDILGYKALLSREPFSASAIALDDCTICFIPRNQFFEAIQKNPKLSMRMLEILASDLTHSEERVMELAQKSVRETFGTNEEDKTINVNLTREEIANIVGTATESVIRLLADFKKSGLIVLKGRKIEIVKQHALIREAHLTE
jgi:CRP-like cAMP-binding protein